MSTRNWVLQALFMGVIAGALPAWGHSYGPPPRVTGAPGDSPLACTLCHQGTPLNGGGGKVEILLTNGPTYTPGATMHIKVAVSDPAQRRWGFELSARLDSDPARGQAGTLASTDSFTQVFCDDGSAAPCASPDMVQFISHTTEGTRPGTPNGATFEFDWTPPAKDVGSITLYVAGNAANGNGSSSGDHIYNSSVQLVPPVIPSTVKPTITANGVVSATTFQTTIAPNTWVTIFGSNLAVGSRLWRGSEIVGGKLPVQLDDLSVTINGKPAYVEYISPGQVNVLTPDDSTTGMVPVVVKNAAGSSDPLMVQLQPVAPGCFLFDGKYLAATHADGKDVGKPGLFPSAPALTTPAKPGEVITLYGSGFGTTDPPAPPGQVVTAVGNLAQPPQFSIGGMPAKVVFSGLTAGFAGVYQFNIEVPAAAPDGDQQVTAQIAGVSTPKTESCCFITVQH